MHHLDDSSCQTDCCDLLNAVASLVTADESGISDNESCGSHAESLEDIAVDPHKGHQFPAGFFDHITIGHFVVDAMWQHGWGAVDLTHVAVKECSGFEGRTFKVSVSDSAIYPSCVAFHVLSHQVAGDFVCVGRMAAAQAVFAAHGLAPPRVTEGDNWFIDAWAGSQVGSVYDLNRPISTCQKETGPPAFATPAELGTLLAKIHAIPPDWYNEWRARVCARDPVLFAADANSHIWPFTARQAFLRALPDEGLASWCQAGPKPASIAGARLVTSHSDFHPANIVRGKGGLQVVDFGLASVTCATKDLAWACEYFLHGQGEKRAFASAYLTASGYAGECDEVDALLIDAECFALHSFTGALYGQLDNLKDDLAHGLDGYSKFAAIAEDALTNASLRSEILQRGLFFCSRYQALI
jgi:hypothetical protein